MRENMQNMLETLSKSSDPQNKAQIGILRENIANLDKLINMTPQEHALDTLKTQIHEMESSVSELTERLSQITLSNDQQKEEKALQMGHGIFITKHVITKLKAASENPDQKLKSIEEVETLRLEATKTALLMRIKQLQTENKPEKYGASIKMLKSRYEQLLSGAHQCSHDHGGHGHSHGGHGHSHGGHGHSHSHGGGHNHSHGSHGHSHSHGHNHGDDDHDDCHDSGHSH